MYRQLPWDTSVMGVLAGRLLLNVRQGARRNNDVNAVTMLGLQLQFGLLALGTMTLRPRQGHFVRNTTSNHPSCLR